MPAIPHLSAYIVGAAGAIIGAILGLLARASGGDELRREKLIEKITEYIEKTLIQNLKEKSKSDFEVRKSQFVAEIQSLFDNLNTQLHNQIRNLVEEEDRLEKAQKELIQRLEGKVEKLHQIAKSCHEIIEGAL